VQDVLLLLEARDGREAHAETRRTLEPVLSRGEPISLREPAVSGHDMLAFRLKGPSVGAALARLLDVVLDDPSRNTREALLALAAS
jgi:tRNA nucleotidyltransferase (CCA-adding enzyme)